MTDTPRAPHRPFPYRTLSWMVTFASFALAIATIAADAWADRAETTASDEEFHRAAQVFTEVFHEIQEKYYEEIDTSALMEAAITGMFTSLDPHSQYMGPDHFDQLTTSTQGEFFGIGIHITIRDGVLTVIAPIPNTPAARLGLQPWDRIIEIDGESTEGMNLPEAVRRIKGPRGTQVELRIFRAPEQEGDDPQFLDFSITRDEIHIDSVFHNVLAEDIGYIRISQFSEETGSELRAAIRDLQGQGVIAIVLDLRWNSGGLLRQAIEVADCFLPPGAMVVSTRGRISSQNRQYQSDHEALTQLPLVVLVNNASASASEIVAGALQDHGRALIIGPAGQTTFGKASVQTIEELRSTLDAGADPRPTAIRLTTAHYFTPNNREIHEVGIEPDIGVTIPPGHERELFQRGLLGDPSTIEDEEHRTTVIDQIDSVFNGDDDEQTNDTEQPEEEDSDEDQDSDEESDSEVELEESGDTVTEVDFDAEEEEADFRDIMLDEAINYIRVYLIMSREAA